MSQYRSMDDAPEGFDENHFLVRQKGVNRRTGGHYVPMVVFLYDGELFTCDDHLHPIKWTKGKNDDIRGDRWTTKVNEANLEWHPLP